MAPSASVKFFFLSTLWVVSATSSGAPVVLATGKLWSIDVRNQITWVV